MKTHRLNPGILIILLGFISFFSVLVLLNLQEFSLPLDTSPFEVTLGESIISLALLLALCAVSARIMLWAYSKIQLPQHPIRIFGYGFLISVAGILLGMVPGIVQGQYIRRLIKDQFPNLSSSTTYINFLSIGFQPVLFTCAIITITLLWITRRKKTKDAPAALLSQPYRKQDILLIIFTLVIYAFLIKSMLEFIILSFSIWQWRPVR